MTYLITFYVNGRRFSEEMDAATSAEARKAIGAVDAIVGCKRVAG